MEGAKNDDLKLSIDDTISLVAENQEKEALAAEKAPEKEAIAAEKAPEKEALVAEKTPEKEALAAEKAPEKEAIAAEKAPDKEALAAEKAPEAEALAAEKALEAEAHAAGKAHEAEALAAEKAPETEALAIGKVPEAEFLAAGKVPETESRQAEKAPEASYLSTQGEITRPLEGHELTSQQQPIAVSKDNGQLPSIWRERGSITEATLTESQEKEDQAQYRRELQSVGEMMHPKQRGKEYEERTTTKIEAKGESESMGRDIDGNTLETSSTTLGSSSTVMESKTINPSTHIGSGAVPSGMCISESSTDRRGNFRSIEDIGAKIGDNKPTCEGSGKDPAQPSQHVRSEVQQIDKMSSVAERPDSSRYPDAGSKNTETEARGGHPSENLDVDGHQKRKTSLNTLNEKISEIFNTNKKLVPIPLLESRRDSPQPESECAMTQHKSLEVSRTYGERSLTHVKDLICNLTEDEKVHLSEKLVNTNLMSSLFCRECEEFYNPNNLPYKLNCGHNFCANCLRTKTEIIFCKICTAGNSIRDPQIVKIPNKDLFEASLMFQEAVHCVETFRTRNKKERYLGRNELTLFGLEDLFEKANLAVEVLTEVEEFVESRLGGIESAHKTLAQAANALMFVEVDLSSALGIIKTIESFCNTIFQIIGYLNDLDRLTILSLQEIRIERRKLRDIKANETKITNEIAKFLCDSHTTCYARMYTPYGRRYSKIFFGRGFVVAKSVTEDINDHDDQIYMIYYSDLHCHCKIHGVFFTLDFGSNNCFSLYMEIQDESLLAQQLFILCIGEHGPSYVNGFGYCTENHLVIQSYTNKEETCYNDFLVAIPDQPGTYTIPKKEYVSTSRVFGKEAELVVHKNTGKDPNYCIGKLCFGIPSKMPCGKFRIKESGIMFVLESSTIE